MDHRVTTYVDKKSGMIHLSYYVHGKRHRPSTGTNNRKNAEIIRQDTEKQLILGQLHHDRVIPVEGAIEKYLRLGRANNKTDKTLSNDKCLIGGFLRWASVRNLNDVTTALINDYIAHKKEKAEWSGPPSIRRFRESIHAFFEYALTLGLSKNPVDGVINPKLTRKEIRYPDLATIDAIMSTVVGDPLEPIVATAIYGGLRRGEIVWLTHDDVDLNEAKPMLKIRTKTIEGKKWSPKNHKERNVPVSKTLYGYLVQQKLRNAGSIWFFPSPEGGHWNGENVRNRLKTALQGAKLKWTLREFRHTLGTFMAKEDHSFDKIAKILGNSARVVAAHYAHLSPEDMHVDVEFRSEVSPLKARTSI